MDSTASIEAVSMTRSFYFRRIIYDYELGCHDRIDGAIDINQYRIQTMGSTCRE